MDHLWIALAILFLAATVQGATGFGFGLVALGLLGNLIDIKDAVIVLAFGSLTLTATVIVRLRHHFSWRDVRAIIPTAILGVPLGVILMVYMKPEVMRAIVGVILIGTTLQNLVPHLAGKRWHPLWLGIPMGLFSGILSGAFATGGPPIIAYYSTQRWGRMRYAVALQSTMFSSAIVRVIELFRHGLFTKELLVTSLWGGVCVAIGGWVGVHILKKMSDVALRRITAIFLFILGARYIVGAVMTWM